MKKRINFLFSALMICAAVGVFVGCADNTLYEPEKPAQERELFKEKLSHEVTQAEARVKLEKLLTKLNLPSTRSGDTNSLPPITSVYTTGKAAVATRAGEKVEPYFHIFNFGDEEGFAIMSGDDRVEPLLALTFKGELTPETEIENPGFEFAYEKMEDYYLRIIRDTIPSIQPDLPIPPRDTLPLPELPVRYEEKDTLIYKNMKYGHCPVKWDQEYPYNQYCFIPGTNNFADAGCAAVAMAQFMAIYKYPNSYNGYSFNWSDMISQYRSYEGELQIARLMQQLGVSNNLNIQYGTPQGSFANEVNIPLTFENLGYTNGGNGIPYNTETVVNELKNGYPLLIGGCDGNTWHIWLGHGLMERRYIIRGYNEFDEVIVSNSILRGYYILYNWGWEGWCDGYYLSGIFDPYTNMENKFPELTRGIDPENYQYDVVTYIDIRK